jgi:chromosome segregation ATPase
VDFDGALTIGEYVCVAGLGAAGYFGRRSIERKAREAKERADEVEKRTTKRTDELEERTSDAHTAAAAAGALATHTYKVGEKILESTATVEVLERLYHESQDFQRHQAVEHARELGVLTERWAECERRHEESAKILETQSHQLQAQQEQLNVLQTTVGALRDVLTEQESKVRGTGTQEP